MSKDSTDIIYGMHAVQGVLKHQSQSVERLYHDNNRRDERLHKLLKLARDNNIPCEATSRKKLTELSGNDNHQGIAIIHRVSEQLASLEQTIAKSSHPLILVLDAITDPHNLGACLRSADAAGVTAVIYPKDKSASITPTVRKIACGAAETVASFAVTNLARTLDELKSQGIWIIGAAGEATQTFYEMDLKGSVAIVVGAEGKGLRRLTRDKCDFLAKLPMQGMVSSLNVSVATGICLYEAVRQRQ